MLENGRPVLVIPREGRFREIGRNIMVAWKPARESARAVSDALPFLKVAETVKILELEEDTSSLQTVESDHRLALVLARHGVEPKMAGCSAERRSAGEALCGRVREDGADLLVLGAYGHSRFREILFGGVTRYIARHMPVPALFSH